MNIPKLCPPMRPGAHQAALAQRPAHAAGKVRQSLAALLLMALTSVLTSAQAQDVAVMPADTVARAVALVREAALALAPPGARVEVLPGALDTRLKLAPCARVLPQLVAGLPAWGRTRVGLRCTEGAARWNVFLPVTVEVWAPAAVATAALPAGALLDAERLKLVATDWAAAPQPPYADLAALAGRTLMRAVPAGQPLRAADLQARQWFAAGDTVRVVSTGAGFSIATEGRALAAGIEGQSVRVRIGESHVAAGRPVGPRLIEVGL